MQFFYVKLREQLELNSFLVLCIYDRYIRALYKKECTTSENVVSIIDVNRVNIMHYALKMFYANIKKLLRLIEIDRYDM